jgi:hypothetical protein
VNAKTAGPGRNRRVAVDNSPSHEESGKRSNGVMGSFGPTWPNGAVGGIDGVGHAVERVFDKARTRAILQFCPLRQEKSAALLLHYTLQMRVSGCN